MVKASMSGPRRLEMLRWPLFAVVIINVVLIGRASWLRVSGSLARASSVAVATDVAAKAPIESVAAAVIEATQELEPPPPVAGDPTPATTEQTPAPTDPVEPPADTVPAPPAATADEPTECVIANPLENRVRVGFLLAGEVCWLAPGESRNFAGDGEWSIVFHRGADLGEHKQSLAAGDYRLVVTPQGWTLEP